MRKKCTHNIVFLTNPIFARPSTVLHRRGGRFFRRLDPMSTLGQKQTSQHVHAMSALPPIADIHGPIDCRPKLAKSRRTGQRPFSTYHWRGGYIVRPLTRYRLVNFGRYVSGPGEHKADITSALEVTQKPTCRIADYCCIDIVIPLRLREASRPTSGPITFKITPFAFCSSATLPPPTIASAAEACEYVPTMSAAVRRFSAVPTKSTADAPMVPTLMPPMLNW